MKVRNKYLVAAWLFAGVFLVGLTLLQGCGNSEPSGFQASAGVRQEPVARKRQVVTASEPTRQIALPAEQTTCPLMGMAIDKSVFTEYKGKKVYFCCAGCIDGFKKDPEKYVAKLPQFSN